MTVLNVRPAGWLGDLEVAQSPGWAGTMFEPRRWRHEGWSRVVLAGAGARDPAALLHLLWHGDLTAGLTRPLSVATVLERAT